jgi:hypothetical protein
MKHLACNLIEVQNDIPSLFVSWFSQLYGVATNEGPVYS